MVGRVPPGQPSREPGEAPPPGVQDAPRDHELGPATEPVGFDGRPIIDRNPCAIRAARPKVDHEPVIAEADQIRALADAMPERLALTVILAGTLGLREGECLALMRRDVDLRRMTVCRVWRACGSMICARPR